MINIVNYLFSLILCLTLIAAPCARAGEIMQAGSELPRESYVFTIEEATDLMRRIEELEAKEKELDKYKELEDIRVRQIDLFKINEEFYASQIDRYKEIDLTNQKIIEKYRRRDKLSGLEKAGFFVLGMGLAFGSISAANAIVANQNSAFANF
jgi:vacuolar-type H+-ATPase subunit I/STV1